MYICLNSIEKVLEFVRDMERCEEEVDLICGRTEIDAKSLMGIFSLDLRRPLEVRVHAYDGQSRIHDLLSKYQIISCRKTA